jgi:hypothetical protein
MTLITMETQISGPQNIPRFLILVFVNMLSFIRLDIMLSKQIGCV